MKRVFGALWCNVFSLLSMAQPSATPVPSEHLEISDSLTTTLIFPYSIIKASWCSPYLAVQQTREVGNVLEIKATTKDFSPSNLSVVTKDGKFYSFLLHYSQEAYPLTLRFAKDSIPSSIVLLNELPVNKQLLENIGAQVMQEKAYLHRRKSNEQLIIQLQNIIVDHHLNWLSFLLKNKTGVPIELAAATVGVRQRKLKSSVAHLQPQEMIHQSLPVQLDAKNKNKIAIAIPRLTMRRQQELLIELLDHSGIPIITLIVPAKLLRKAKMLAH